MIDEFIVDKSNVETGVQEAIKLMKVGDRAKLIIPAHLAHGITGDMNKIPPISTLIVDLKLYSAE
jgi:FKBP-type peptidyl-prolyl cis-trans isomerase